LVFFLYDRKVERRQVTVLHTAVRSSAIVSSLFPSEVRDRLYDNNAAASTQPSNDLSPADRSETSKSPAKKRSSVASILLPDTTKGKLSSFLRDTQLTSPLVATSSRNNDAGGQDVMNASTNPLLVGAPIAELYPETTVLFADICGFTAWSSERHPAQVRTVQ
jgi:hypothetical protein